MGFLLGLAPLILAVLGILSLNIPGISGVPFTLLLELMGLGLFCLEALVVLPMVIVPGTRTIGLGLAAGFAIVCGYLAYLTATGFWNGLFG